MNNMDQSKHLFIWACEGILTLNTFFSVCNLMQSLIGFLTAHLILGSKVPQQDAP